MTNFIQILNKLFQVLTGIYPLYDSTHPKNTGFCKWIFNFNPKSLVLIASDCFHNRPN